MKILIVHPEDIPRHYYGGTERVIWYLGKELVRLGHEVTYLVKAGSTCDFAPVIHIDPNQPEVDQIPPNQFDLVHFHWIPQFIDRVQEPYLMTMHGNKYKVDDLNQNIVFVSKNHAQRFGGEAYVHNGLDWEDYGQPSLTSSGNYFHFLGNAAWRVKNVKGAIEMIRATENEKLKVLGGVRFNFKMGLRLTFSSRISFHKKVGGEIKNELVRNSKGLIFPVRWHEPFGLAIIESLYLGSPVIGTPYGSLPELVTEDVGFLSNKKEELVNAIENINRFDRRQCHEYAKEKFSSQKMTQDYLKLYEKVLDGEPLNRKPPVIKSDKAISLLPWYE